MMGLVPHKRPNIYCVIMFTNHRCTRAEAFVRHLNGRTLRLILPALLLAVLWGLAACSTAAPAEVEPTEEPTAEPPRATQQPTAEPTPTPEEVAETEEPTEEATDEPVAGAADENCINCHADQEMLASLATEPEAAAVESSGEG